MDGLIDAAESISSKSKAVRALHQECSKAGEVAKIVIAIATKLKADTAQIPEVIAHLKQGVTAINEVIHVCLLEPVKANLLAKSYLFKLTSAIVRIQEAIAVDLVNVDLSRRLQGIHDSLCALDNDIAHGLKAVVQSDSKAIVPFLLKHGIATDADDAKIQLELLQAEIDDILGEDEDIIETEILKKVSALSVDALNETPLQFDLPEAGICPLSLHLMQDPVYLAACDRSFERSFLEAALKKNPHQDPITGHCHQEKLSFTPNNLLKNAIEAWQQKIDDTQTTQPLQHESASKPRDLLPEASSSQDEWLTPLSKNDPTVTKLDLSKQKINDKDTRAIATALDTNTSLQELDLSDNKIGEEGAVAIATALGTNTSLQTLNLNGNKISVDGREALAMALGTSPALQTLKVEGNES